MEQEQTIVLGERPSESVEMQGSVQEPDARFAMLQVNDAERVN